MLQSCGSQQSDMMSHVAHAYCVWVSLSLMFRFVVGVSSFSLFDLSTHTLCQPSTLPLDLKFLHR